MTSVLQIDTYVVEEKRMGHNGGQKYHHDACIVAAAAGKRLMMEWNDIKQWRNQAYSLRYEVIQLVKNTA